MGCSSIFFREDTAQSLHLVLVNDNRTAIGICFRIFHLCCKYALWLENKKCLSTQQTESLREQAFVKNQRIFGTFYFMT